MRVLIVSPWLPHPHIAHAGGETLFHTVRSLVERGHAVHLLCYGRGESEEQRAAAAQLCASLQVITPAYSLQAKLASFIHGGWRQPWLLGRRTHAEMRRALQEICRRSAIEIVQFFWTEMGRYLDAAPSATGTILSTLDVEACVRPRELELLPPGPARWQARVQTRRLIRDERRYVAAAGAVTVCSAADRAQLARFGAPERIFVTPPWLDLPALQAVTPDRLIPGRLTFMGALDRVANAAAARFLLTEVWSRIQRAYPTATLHIVGAAPPAWLRRAAASDPRVQVTGWAPDLVEVWAQTDIAVCPSLTGGGLLLKVAQPMAAGRPVVTTTLGNEGTAAPEDAVAIADDPAAFAQEVLRLLEDRAYWERLAQAGRRHITATLDWESSMDQLEAALRAARSCRALPALSPSRRDI